MQTVKTTLVFCIQYPVHVSVRIWSPSIRGVPDAVPESGECRREKGGGVCPGVCISQTTNQYKYIKACAGIREHTRPTTAKRVRECSMLVNGK